MTAKAFRQSQESIWKSEWRIFLCRYLRIELIIWTPPLWQLTQTLSAAHVNVNAAPTRLSQHRGMRTDDSKGSRLLQAPGSSGDQSVTCSNSWRCSTVLERFPHSYSTQFTSLMVHLATANRGNYMKLSSRRRISASPRRRTPCLYSAAKRKRVSKG